jgi:hypothetical protein
VKVYPSSLSPSYLTMTTLPPPPCPVAKLATKQVHTTAEDPPTPASVPEEKSVRKQVYSS